MADEVQNDGSDGAASQAAEAAAGALGGSDNQSGPNPGGGEASAAQSQGTEGAGTQPGPGPWASDLERFPEEVRGDLDAYLRETWQPRVTQLEQSQMPEGISQFLEDIGNPETSDQAFLQMAYELYGEDAIPFFETALQYAYGGEGQGDEGQGPEFDDEGFEIDLDPEDRSALDFVREQQEDQLYTEALTELQQAHQQELPGDAEQLKLLLSPFVYAADGDIEAGYALYEQWRQTSGLTPQEAAQAVADSQQGQGVAGLTPQVLGLEGQAPGVPSVKQGQSISDAVDDLMADMRASKGPPALG